MTKTANYQLNQWEPTDEVRREDFNQDNAAIDAAIKAVQTAAEDRQAALKTLIAAKGNCKIAYGTYTGTGTYGVNNPNSLSFDFTPVVVFVCAKASSDPVGPMVRGQTQTRIGTMVNSIEWSDNGVSWYYVNDYGESFQMNEKGIAYFYAAIGV